MKTWQYKVERWEPGNQLFVICHNGVWAASPEDAIDAYRDSHDFDALRQCLYRVTPVGPTQIFQWEQPVPGQWVEHWDSAL